MSNNPKSPDIPDFKEQGTLIECIHCTILSHEINPNCPECHGNKSYFVPAQLLDRFSRQQLIIHDLFNRKSELDSYLTKKLELSPEEVRIIENSFMDLLKKVIIYNFDLKDFLINSIKDLHEH